MTQLHIVTTYNEFSSTTCLFMYPLHEHLTLNYKRLKRLKSLLYASQLEYIVQSFDNLLHKLLMVDYKVPFLTIL